MTFNRRRRFQNKSENDNKTASMERRWMINGSRRDYRCTTDNHAHEPVEQSTSVDNKNDSNDFIDNRTCDLQTRLRAVTRRYFKSPKSVSVISSEHKPPRLAGLFQRSRPSPANGRWRARTPQLRSMTIPLISSKD